MNRNDFAHMAVKVRNLCVVVVILILPLWESVQAGLLLSASKAAYFVTEQNKYRQVSCSCSFRIVYVDGLRLEILPSTTSAIPQSRNPFPKLHN